MPFEKYESLLDVLKLRAMNSAEASAFCFLKNGESESARISYSQLDHRARMIASVILEKVDPGRHVLLAYPSGLEFIVALFGCWYAGMVAVPVFPPRENRHFYRFLNVAKDSDVVLALTSSAVLEKSKSLISKQGMHFPVPLISTEQMTGEPADGLPPVKADMDTLAYLQYTSGSTGNPKGVMVCHGNLLHNLECLRQCFGLRPKRTCLSWLPNAHDMGLVKGILLPLYSGVPGVLMAPASFVQRPLRWLKAISEYRVYHSGGPNFAYDLCIKGIKSNQAAELDLSCWKSAINGAEPVRKSTLERFFKKFSSCGFRKSAFAPCYGMAENTLIITGQSASTDATFHCLDAVALQDNRIIEQSEDSKTDICTHVVGCGKPFCGTELRIVDPMTLNVCPSGKVGEIWVTGESVARGYYNRNDDTRRNFHAHTADSLEGPFLRTGDLGYLKDEELFITGRLKDIIIIRGRNHYPQDIEFTVEQCNSALKPNSSAAFAIKKDEKEYLAMVLEVKRQALKKLNEKAILASIRNAVTKTHGIQVDAIVLVKPGSISKTTSGKIQRSSCRKEYLSGSLKFVASWKSKQLISIMEQAPARKRKIDAGQGRDKDKERVIRDWLIQRIACHSDVPAENVKADAPFADFSLDSVRMTALSAELEDRFGCKLTPTALYDFPNINVLSRKAAGDLHRDPGLAEPAPGLADESGSIAVIGMGCRLPGAENPDEFLDLLQCGKSTVGPMSHERWADFRKNFTMDSVDPLRESFPGGYLDRVDLFDADFFNLTVLEAQSMDPQQRLVLEVAWEAMENAGIAPGALGGSLTGVFLGICSNDYARLQFNRPELFNPYSATGGALSIAANRLSYAWDLRGPSLVVDTACSSSLVAVIQACASLARKDSNLAIAGGVNLILTPDLTKIFSKMGMLATDGRCKTFDATADGYVRGEGCGIVILKRLEDALQNKDRVLAVLRGWAINQDGRSSGITAPNGPAQETVIRKALGRADISPESVYYLETHGTGTALGDAIEVQSLNKVLAKDRLREGPCFIGSVKANIGHLEAAAGIAGLIKTILSIDHNEIFPHTKVEHVNPKMGLDSEALIIPAETIKWPKGRSKTAGVSSFGFGGTNAHIVLTQLASKPELRTERRNRLPQVLPLSGKRPSALRDLAGRFGRHLESSSRIRLVDVCFTASTAREHFPLRKAFIAASVHEMGQILLETTNSAGTIPDQSNYAAFPSKFVYLFKEPSGLHEINLDMLSRTCPKLRRLVSQADDTMRRATGVSLISLVEGQKDNFPASDRLALAYPAGCCIQWAFAEMWREWGIGAAASVGSGSGAFAAASFAGLYSLEMALKLALTHGYRIAGHLPTSKALKVAAGNIAHLLPAGFDGSFSQELNCRLLIADAHEADADCSDPGFWRQHIDTVSKKPDMPAKQALTDRTIKELRKIANPRFLCFESTNESGCRIEESNDRDSVYACASDWPKLLHIVKSLYEAGAEINWPLFYDGVEAHRVPLPTYPFQRHRCWLSDTGSASRKHDSRFGAMPLADNGIDWRSLSEQVAEDNGFGPDERNILSHVVQALSQRRTVSASTTAQFDKAYDVMWQPRELKPDCELGTGEAPLGSWLVFSDNRGIGRDLSKCLKDAGHKIQIVRMDELFSGAEGCAENTDFGPIISAIIERFISQNDPGRRWILYLWPLNSNDSGKESIQKEMPFKDFECRGLLAIIKALANCRHKSLPKVWMVTSGAVSIDGKLGEQGLPQTPMWGIGNVAALEHPEFWGGAIDLLVHKGKAKAKHILAEILNNEEEKRVALHEGNRYVQRLIAAKAPNSNQVIRISPDAAYLITGGLGALGLQIAQWLVDKGARHLLLVGRSKAKKSIRHKLAALSESGARIEILRADVTRIHELQQAMQSLKNGSPPLKGVFHAAGSMQNTLLQRAALKQFNDVASAKILGGWHLHRLTCKLPLDFFILFSSAASILGAVGQADYAAGNAYLDGLAHFRRGKGMPALSINWGPWSGQGLASYRFRDNGDEMAQMGMASIDPQFALSLMECFSAQPIAQRAVLAVDWPLFVTHFPGEYRDTLFEFVVRPNGQQNNEPAVANRRFARQLLETPPERRLDYAIGYLKKQISLAARYDAHRLQSDTPVQQVGLDSLKALEVRHRILKDTGVSISVAHLLGAYTIADLSAQIVQGLDASQKKSLTELKADTGGTIRKPLSYGQRALWFLHQMDPKSAGYNIAIAANIYSNVDTEALERALQAAIDYHPILCSAFSADEDGQPVRIVCSKQEVCFEKAIVSGLEPEQIRIMVETAFRRPFDLERKELFRAHLFSYSETGHVLLLTMHHIIADGWSLWRLMDELGRLYTAALKAGPLQIEYPRNSYNDFVKWEADLVAGAEGERQLAYWRKQLAGEPAVLDLNTDYPRQPEQSYRGEVQNFQVPAALIEKLKCLASDGNATLQMLLMAIFQVLLHRYSRQNDILVGMPAAGRSRPEFTDILGYMVNMVVIRTNFEGDPAFMELMNQVRTLTLEALEHQDYPFPLLVEKINPNRELGRTPLFQASFIYQQPQRFSESSGLSIDQTIDWGGLKLSHYNINQQEGIFDLSLEIVHLRDRLDCALKYNANLFAPWRIRQMADCIIQVMQGVCDEPTRNISAISMLTAQDRKRLLHEFNHTTGRKDYSQSVHRAFESQVEKTPHSAALKGCSFRWTYDQLNRRANRIAHHLQNFGVKRDALIGLCAMRGPGMVAAMLGILKAGGVYVPLDPSYPAERLKKMVEEIDLAVALVDEASMTLLTDVCNQLISIEDMQQSSTGAGDENLSVDRGAEDPAYLMFTSGSTGRPKGVSVPHRGIVRLVKGAAYFDVSDDDVFLHFSAPSFDAATFEIWAPLLNGASLVFMDNLLPSMKDLGKAIRDFNVTTLWLSSGLFNIMAEEHLEDLKGLKQLLVGGDVLSPPHIRKALDELKSCTLINGYGPTENTTFTCSYKIPRDFPINQSIPIGRPIDGTEIYILDENFQPVPPGMTGELFIGGSGLAREYLNRPELTREKFIRICVEGNDDKRLYRSGDLVEFMPDGVVRFLGRCDQQVKIRGFRVEPGEIESALRRHQSVRDAKVIAVGRSAHEKRLVAFAAIGSESTITAATLKDYLADHLPNYMQPTNLVLLDALPLNSNGKVDREALLRSENPSGSSKVNESKDDLEKIVCGILQDTLGVACVEPERNFFDLGAHSLLMNQIHSRLARALHSDINLIDLYRYPTVRSLAQHLKNAKNIEDPTNDFSRLSAIVAKQVNAMKKRKKQYLIRT